MSSKDYKPVLSRNTISVNGEQPENIIKGGIDDTGSIQNSNPFNIQIDGNHYKDFEIQPTEFIMKNKLNFCVGNIIKYVCRYDKKDGKLDLEKARHYIDLLIKLEYDDEDKRIPTK